jgi:hypothetical protein
LHDSERQPRRRIRSWTTYARHIPGHALGKTVADEVASAKSTTRIVDTGRRSEAGTVRRASGNDVAHVEEHCDLQDREQQENQQDGDHRELCDRGTSIASAASDERSDAHEQRVAHC